MSVRRGLFVRKDSTLGTDPVAARLGLAGLVTPAGDLGVTPGVISGCAVSGRSTAPAWAYSVSAGHVVTTRGSADGAVVFAVDGATDTPTVSAAPATGSRWDLIWVRHRDVDNADPDSNSVLGVTSGASSGSPSKPYGSVPAGALVLAEAQVSAGAANTADPLVTITPVSPRVATRGGIIPVASTTQRDLLAAAGSVTNPVYVDLAGVISRSTGGSSWPAVAGSPVYAHMERATQATPPSGSEVVLSTWTTETLVGGITVSSGVYTVPRAGRYLVAFGFSYAGTAGGVRQGIVTKNGTLASNRVILEEEAGSSAATQTIAGSRVVELAAGDTIQLRTLQNSGGTAPILAGNAGTPFWFNIDWVGGL